MVDEAFLRRIPYKVNIADPSEAEFHRLFEFYAPKLGFRYRREAVDYLVQTHYRPFERGLRRCHPRDLLGQIRNYCVYNEMPVEMLPEHFDRVVKSYFTKVIASTEKGG